MSLSMDAKTYELEKFEKHALLIFNLDKRPVTNTDVEALSKTFGNFGFEVVEYKDLTKDEIIETIKSFTINENLSKLGCVWVAVLADDSNNDLLIAIDQQFMDFDIMEAFNVPALASKPKHLFYRIYLDEDVDPDNTPLAPDMHVFNSTFEGCSSYSNHDRYAEDSFHLLKSFIVYIRRASSVHHQSRKGLDPFLWHIHVSLMLTSMQKLQRLNIIKTVTHVHKNAIDGTWFIQVLCETIKENPYKDFKSIMNEVQNKIAINYQSEEYDPRTRAMVTYKQMPVQWSTLTDKLYLKMDDFSLLKKLLNTVIEKNPNDQIAIFLLDIANTCKNGANFDELKLKLIKMISNHLSKYSLY